jgi:uncharacterized membrane protein (DUF2068 family)
MASKRSDTVMVVIGAFKLVKALLLILVGVGAFSHGVRKWIGQFQPSNHYLHELIGKIANMSPHTFTIISIAAFCYAALFCVEGFGLLWKKTWAEYFTTIITVSFIPLEVYEMVEKANVLKAGVIALNIAIVIYLLIRLKHDGRWPWKSAEAVSAG